MKNRTAVLFGMLLGLGLSLSQVAQVNGEAGGLPALTGRVTVLESSVATQQTTTATLDDRVATLELAISELRDQVATLKSQRPMFAVVNVESDGTLKVDSSSGVQKVQYATDDDGHPIGGHVDVFFNKPDVSKCAATVTAEPSYSAGLIASINGTFRGISFPPHFPLNVITVVLSEGLNDRIDTGFNIIVVC